MHGSLEAFIKRVLDEMMKCIFLKLPRY